MKYLNALLAGAGSLMFVLAGSALAAAPAAAPAGATGLCQDGTYYTGAEKMGACRGHKGVKEWYGTASAAAVGTAAATAAGAKPAAAPAAIAAPAPATPAPAVKAAAPSQAPAAPAPAAKAAPSPAPAAPAAAAVKPKAETSAPAAAGSEKAAAAKNMNADVKARLAAPPAPGGGAGKVWVNADSKVYHCEGDRYYGKTKQGEYMSEADAKAKGFHGSHGKACAST